jgi:tetratricopeptide (TPR) repeat protein
MIISVSNRELGNRRNEAIALGNLGHGWLELGAHEQALSMLEDSLRLARAISDHTTQPNTLTKQSLLALRQGDDALTLAHARAALDIAVEVRTPDFELLALCALGDAELALGRYAAAPAAFEPARGLALQAVQDLLPRVLEGEALAGTEAAHRIRLNCCQVLGCAGDARAAKLLAQAHAELPVAAVTFTDTELRHSFLHNVPEHQAIMAAWAADPASRFQ